VVALVHFDLRQRGLIGEKIALCGTNGNKFTDIRRHFDEKIVFSNLPNLEFEQFPQAGEVNPKAYLEALEQFAKPGDVCSVFTPDDSHFEIIMAALDRGLHVMATKPMVKTLKEHQLLVEKARAKGVLLQIEVILKLCFISYSF
jgi:D-galacturonate reductase